MNLFKLLKSNHIIARYINVPIGTVQVRETVGSPRNKRELVSFIDG